MPRGICTACVQHFSNHVIEGTHGTAVHRLVSRRFSVCNSRLKVVPNRVVFVRYAELLPTMGWPLNSYRPLRSQVTVCALILDQRCDPGVGQSSNALIAAESYDRSHRLDEFHMLHFLR